MSTQHAGYPPVAFSSTQPQQTLRLMELPPELVALIEARTEREPVRLHLKSAHQSSSSKRQNDKLPSTAESSTPGFLHLCTVDKVWAVKQVSTSNSVFVTKTGQLSSSRRDIDGDIDMDQETSNGPQDSLEDHTRLPAMCGELSIISQVKNILELIPVEPSEQEIRQQILTMVQVRSTESDDDDFMELKTTDRIALTFHELIDNIPAPGDLCCRVARELFVIHDPSFPDKAAVVALGPSILLAAWKEFLQQCTILGIKIDGSDGRSNVVPQEQCTFGQVFASLNEQHDPSRDAGITEYPVDTLRAILRRFKKRHNSTSINRSNRAAEMLDDNWDLEPLDGGWETGPLTHSLGAWELARLLRLPGAERVEAEAFLKKHWQDLLPDAWHSLCNVQTLLDRCRLEEVLVESYNETVRDQFGIEEQKLFIRPLGTGVRMVGVGGQPITSTPQPSSGAAASAKVDDPKEQKKRKWHEKFGAQRNAAAKK